MRIFSGEAWIGDQYMPVTFIQAKGCNFDKNNFEKVLKSDDEAVAVDSEIQETYLKHRVGEHPDWGKGYWSAVDKSERGASLFYYAKTKFVEG